MVTLTNKVALAAGSAEIIRNAQPLPGYSRAPIIAPVAGT